MGAHRRFFIEPEAISGTEATLTGPLAHQIGHVLRLKPDDEIMLLDGSGDELSARIVSISKDTVKAEILERRPCPREPRVKLTLAICLPKRDKLDQVIQSCTELGVSRFLIALSERSVPRIDAERLATRLTRWRRIAKEAAEQCGRGRVPEIHALFSVRDLATLGSEHDLALVAWEDETSVSLRVALHHDARRDDVSGHPCPETPASVLLVIGPEGGLASYEVALLTSSGARTVSLGRLLLRVETAAIAGCAMLLADAH